MATGIRTLGAQLRESRNAKGLSLREIEKRSGVNSGYLSQLERDEIKHPNPTVLQKLAGAYEEPFLVLMQWAGYVEEGISPNAQRALSLLGDDFTDHELQALRAVLDVLRGSGTPAFSAVHRTDLILAESDLETIRRHALAILRESDNLGDQPVDFDSVNAVAKLVSVGAIELTLEEKRDLRRRFGSLVDRVLTALRGVVHLDSGEVYVNPDLHEMAKRFVLGHEAGHAVLPDHRAVFAHLDDKTRLTPEFNDLLERQANQFSIELLAKGDRLREEFDDSAPSGSALCQLQGKYQLSLQALARRVAEESHRPVAVAISHKAFAGQGDLMPARLYCSAAFDYQLAWSARRPSQLLEDSARACRLGAQITSSCHVGVNGRPVIVHADGIDTPYAAIVLFWTQTQSSLRRLNPFLRA